METGLSNVLGSLHPLIVHFPIALLFTVPAFIIPALLFPQSLKSFLISAWFLMLLGTAGLFLASASGESAAEALQPNPAIASVLETHEHFAEQSRLNFSVLTAVLSLYLLVLPKCSLKISPRIASAAACLFLIVYGAGLLSLFNAAHAGGRLVHEYGAKSKLYAAP